MTATFLETLPNKKKFAYEAVTDEDLVQQSLRKYLHEKNPLQMLTKFVLFRSLAAPGIIS